MVSYLGNGITFPVAFAGDIKASGIAFPVVGLVLLILRALIYATKRVGVGIAEAFAVFSWLNILGMGVVFVWSAEKGGLGWPTPTNVAPITETTISGFEKNVALSEYIFLILMVVALGTTKLSLLFFFRKIIASTHRTIWGYASIFLIVVVSLWTIAFTLAYIFICGRNPTAFWSPEDVRAKQCLPITGGEAVIEKACFISDLILDIACILLPFPIILGLHLQLRFKITITAVFMVGIMTVIAGIVRLVIWIEILDTAGNTSEDFNLAVTLALQWGMIEAGLAFIVSQLPALSAYLNKSARNDIAKTIRHAASVVTIRSSDSRGSGDRSKVGHDLEHSAATEQHELSRIRREDAFEVRTDSAKASDLSDDRPGDFGRLIWGGHHDGR